MAEKLLPFTKNQIEEIIKNIRRLSIFMTKRLSVKTRARLKKLLPGTTALKNFSLLKQLLILIC